MGRRSTCGTLRGRFDATFAVVYLAVSGSHCEIFTLGSLTTDSTGNAIASVTFTIPAEARYLVAIDRGSEGQWTTEFVQSQ
jgi:hypothetical protein